MPNQEKVKNIVLEELPKYFSLIMILIVALQFFCICGGFLYKNSSLIFNILTILSGILIYFGLRNNADEKQQKVGDLMFKFLLVFSTMLIINHGLISFINKVTEVVKNNKLEIIIVMFDLVIIAGCIALFNQDSFKDFIENTKEADLSTLLSGKKVEVIKKGDAVLGKAIDYDTNKQTDIPVVLPLKDRFLHMLILGPTGCGKTSQSIIPMINRDAQNPDLGIIVLEPKGDLAEKIHAMAIHYNREVVYFNPVLPDCPYFNPLFGEESDVVENMATTFNMLNPDSPQFFKDMSEGLIRRSTKLLKRLYGDDATLIDLSTLVWDTNGQGRKMVLEFSRKRVSNPDIQKENEEIYSWFLNDYYSGMGGQRGGSKTYEHCSGIRSQISKLVSNKYLRRVLNPPKGRGSDIDFDKALENGTIVTITSSLSKLGSLGKFLGFFIILQLQSSVFRRPGLEDDRRPCMLYIDEFQVYSNPGFADMLTMGRSYRVASHLATQARDQIGMGSGKDGKAFIQLVSTNARNKIIYPGISAADAKYYSEEFGTITKTVTGKTYAKKRFFSGLDDHKVSTSIKEEEAERFSISNLIYKNFGEITYCIVKNNTVQYAGVSKIEYIPKDLNKTLDEMVKVYNAEQFEKALAIERALNEECNGDNKPEPTVNNDLVVKEFKDPISAMEDDVVMSEVATDTISDDDIIGDSFDKQDDIGTATTVNSSIMPVDIDYDDVI